MCEMSHVHIILGNTPSELVRSGQGVLDLSGVNNLAEGVRWSGKAYHDQVRKSTFGKENPMNDTEKRDTGLALNLGLRIDSRSIDVAGDHSQRTCGSVKLYLKMESYGLRWLTMQANNLLQCISPPDCGEIWCC